MARLPNAFNVESAEKLGDFRAIPAGTYIAQIVKSEMKETTKKNGQYLQLQFVILDGEYAKRTVFSRLNLVNENQQTSEIAHKSLATIGECCGISNLEDSEQLHNVPMYIDVVVRPALGQYTEQNDIKGYKKYDGAQAASPRAASPNAGPAKTPPWKK
jgi:Protein of unknown function (DUF669)